MITTTATRDAHGLRDIQLTVHRLGTANTHLDIVRGLYRSVYAEPPYDEGPDDVEMFIADWPERTMRPGFKLVMAWHRDAPVGFTFGYVLNIDTLWWQGIQEPIDGDLTHEYPGRTFAIIELAMLRTHRQHGIGRELHAHLLAGLPNERVTLLVRPEAEVAQKVYHSWDYRCVGQIRPFDDAPIYDAMILSLRQRSNG
ncbi:MAG: GNAT family N-acetyltransferase [Pseudonocardia sp.]